jgi:hypothetical protein
MSEDNPANSRENSILHNLASQLLHDKARARLERGRPQLVTMISDALSHLLPRQGDTMFLDPGCSYVLSS